MSLLLRPQTTVTSAHWLQKYHVSLGMDVSTPHKTRQGVMRV